LLDDDGEAVPWSRSSSDDGRNVLRVWAPRHETGTITLVAQYRIDLSRQNRGEQPARTITIPLIRPIETHYRPTKPFRIANLDVTAIGSLIELASSSAWSTASGKAPTSTLSVSGNGESPIELVIRPSDIASKPSLLVDVCLLQTWLVPGGRFERAVFKFETQLESALIQLPLDANSNALDVFVDGIKSTVRASSNELTVELPSTETQQHLVEVNYPVINERRASGGIDLVFPRLAAAEWTRQMIWQLIMPRNEHLLIG